MGYGLIEISRVGEPEFPLVRVLYDAIFAGVAPSERPQLTLDSADRDVIVLAHLEGNPLGFGVGQIEGDTCVLRAAGVLAEYRRQGIGGRLVAMVAGISRTQGCVSIVIESPAACAAMVGLARSLGFEEMTGGEDDGMVRFRKGLAKQ